MPENPLRRSGTLVPWTMALLGLVTTFALLTSREKEREQNRKNLETQTQHFDRENRALTEQIKDLQKSAAQRDTEMAARSQEIAQREAAIAGREDAATERTQSSFQGLLIQQNLLKNLEALKASLPDMSPEVERLAKEHAQFDAEVQRLRKENAELRRK